MNWIKARLNKDNLWNMIFWLGMTIGIAIAQYFSDSQELFILSVVSTLLIVPLITKSAQSVKFDKEHGFFTSNGRSLSNSLPKYLGLTIIVSAGMAFLSSLITFPSIALCCSMFILFIVLYFTLINCPISFLFNKNALEPMPYSELKKRSSLNRMRYSEMYCNSIFHYTRDIKRH